MIEVYEIQALQRSYTSLFLILTIYRAGQKDVTVIWFVFKQIFPKS